jgi:MSHA pilin protein MshA
MNVKTSQKGFTLIELVVVIVILGILAVTAAPKFIDLTSDAKASVVEAVKASINSAADMAHAKALVSGQTNESGSISAANTTIAVKYGWPTTEAMAALLQLDSEISEVSGAAGSFKYESEKAGASTDADYCRAVYTNEVTNAETRPAISSKTDGC